LGYVLNIWSNCFSRSRPPPFNLLLWLQTKAFYQTLSNQKPDCQPDLDFIRHSKPYWAQAHNQGAFIGLTWICSKNGNASIKGQTNWPIRVSETRAVANQNGAPFLLLFIPTLTSPSSGAHAIKLVPAWLVSHVCLVTVGRPYLLRLDRRQNQAESDQQVICI
jgi:hypothetical protein